MIENLVLIDWISFALLSKDGATHLVGIFNWLETYNQLTILETKSLKNSLKCSQLTDIDCSRESNDYIIPIQTILNHY